MSKRTKLQKEYYKEFGNYKGNGKYSDDYVSWLEDKVLAINCAKQIMQEYHKSDLISKVAPILKSLQVLRINVYSGQSAFDIANIEKAKRVAIKEVNRRIVTKTQAKDDFVKWIKETSSKGGFDKHILQFWDEVIKQVGRI